MLLNNMNNQENQKKQNGNRRYSILLLALLFIGMATYGTYAYFTDSTSVNGNIKLETGTVKFSDITESNWEYQKNGNEKISSTEVEDFDFKNIQPGDSFVKTAVVEYTGSLNGILEVKPFTENEEIEGLDYNIAIKTPHEDNMVVSGDKVIVTLTATLPIGDEESYSSGETNRNNQVNKVIDLTELEKAVEISVKQTGQKAQPR